MEQVGYDMYCKLLDEVMTEMKVGKQVNSEPQEDVQIDINVSSYIPDKYIENSDIKISLYQDIALCKNEEEILDVTDEIIDRFGEMPKEVENLIEIARIKILCIQKGINKINQREKSVVFYLSDASFNMESVNKLIEIYKYNMKFLPSAMPYITYKFDENKPIIKQIKEFLNNM